MLWWTNMNRMEKSWWIAFVLVIVAVLALLGATGYLVYVVVEDYNEANEKTLTLIDDIRNLSIMINATMNNSYTVQ